MNVENYNRIYNEIEKFKANIHNEHYEYKEAPVVEEEEFDLDFLNR